MELKKETVVVRPVFKKMFIAAIVIYVVGSMMIQINLCNRLGSIEHQLVHLSTGHH